jgi:hypothetical protein
VVVRILQKVNTVTLSWDEKKYDEAVKELNNIITTPTYFKENRKVTLLYVDETQVKITICNQYPILEEILSLLDEEEERHCDDICANKHAHMGNRTFERAGSFHSGLKGALGHQSATKLNFTTIRMHNYYQKKVRKWEGLLIYFNKSSDISCE